MAYELTSRQYSIRTYIAVVAPNVHHVGVSQRWQDLRAHRHKRRPAVRYSFPLCTDIGKIKAFQGESNICSAA